MIEELTKPQKVVIDPTEYVKSLLANGLEKDLYETDDYTEEICEICHGTGVVKIDNRFMLREDNGYMHGPYKRQSMWWCYDCYNGVVRRCKHCGKLLPKGRLKCDCEAIRERERAAEAKKLQEAWDKAEELGPDALGTKFGMCYSNLYPDNEGYFDEWESFFEAWDFEHKDSPRPQYVWGTDDVEMHIDAGDIVENATCELYGEAYDAVSDKAMKELQTFLNDWCERCGVGKTYMESHDFKVRIPWEEYKPETQEKAEV